MKEIKSDNETGPKLWLGYATAVLGSAFTFGWNIGATNLPEAFIRCWIQETFDTTQFTSKGLSCEMAREAAAYSNDNTTSDWNETSELKDLQKILNKSTKKQPT